ncbi:hypothetical protein PINS_up008171 [Pythium insidiosum]|nr:hypothetical protein PINS_up008171 [Pythium insidiosum]
MPLLGDDVEQLHSSILPHLVPRLPATTIGHSSVDGHVRADASVDASHELLLQEDAFQVFRRYVAITSDLGGVVDVLVNMGLAHRRASVREATLVAIGRLLHERYSRRGARVDRDLFVGLLQAAVPTLEDPSERVVVATEETLARLRVLWGDHNFNAALSFLSAEDNATLQAHESPIDAFARATASSDGAGPSGVSASQVLRLRGSLDISDSGRSDSSESRLRFGFVPPDVVETIESASGSSNAEWKQRTAAVERLYAAAKRLDARSLQTEDASIVALSELMLRLVRDSDTHVVKRGLQILRLVWIQLCALADLENDNENDGGNADARRSAPLESVVRRTAAPLVEAAATYNYESTGSISGVTQATTSHDDDVLSPHFAALWTALSDGTSRLPVHVLSAALLSDALMRHRRLQVREQAFIVWEVCIRAAHTARRSFAGVMSSPVIRALGRGLGDSSSRVRKAAMDATATLQQAVRLEDITARLEAELEDFEIDRVDWDAMHARLRRRQETREPAAKLRTDSALVLPKEESERSVERQPRRRAVERQLDDDSERVEAYTQSKSLGRSREPSVVARVVASAPSEPIADKLQCLKSKTEKLQKAATARQLPIAGGPCEATGARNPQEGDVMPITRLSRSQSTPVDVEEAVAEDDYRDECARGAPETRALASDDRPIRPMKQLDALTDAFMAEPQPESQSAPTRRRGAAPMSLATRKRLEAKQRHEQEAVTTITPAAPIATTEASSLDGDELAPLKDPKQEATRLLQRLRRESSVAEEDWERAVEALTMARRLARHHSAVLQSHIVALVPEILAHVPSLRSAVARAAMQAVDDVCCALGPSLDSTVDTLLSVLLRRCADSNSFLSETAAAAVHAVARNCSPSRVASALATQASSRAVPIRREVARAAHVVLMGLADPSTAAPSLLQLVGRALEDSHNEVRDVAKQSIVFLHTERRMDVDRLKRLLPTSTHTRLEQLLATAPRANRPGAVPAKVSTTTNREDFPAPTATAKRAQLAVDADSVAALAKKLDSATWSDRVDALLETTRFMQRHSAALVASGKALTLLDGVIARLEDGNAKVCTQALESLVPIIAALGDGLEPVLPALLGALAKGLAASNSRQAALASDSLQALSTRLEARVLCPHLAAVAKHANTRVKPSLLAALERLVRDSSPRNDDKTQLVLTRYSLALPLVLLMMTNAHCHLARSQTRNAAGVGAAEGKQNGYQRCQPAPACRAERIHRSHSISDSAAQTQRSTAEQTYNDSCSVEMIRAQREFKQSWSATKLECCDFILRNGTST